MKKLTIYLFTRPELNLISDAIDHYIKTGNKSNDLMILRDKIETDWLAILGENMDYGR